jgi:hypothetical protein
MKRNGKSEPLDLHVLIGKEGRLYSALCLELDVASQGRSIAEAKKMSLRQSNSTLKVSTMLVKKKNLFLGLRRLKGG